MKSTDEIDVFIEKQIDLMDKTNEQIANNAREYHRSYCPNQGDDFASMICEHEFMHMFAEAFKEALMKRTMQRAADRNQN